jgi:pyridoxal phosphate enzyme (YggS family)
MSIAQNLAEVMATLPGHVTLVAVSKTKSAEKILEAYHAGQRHFGENKVQEMAAKADALPKDIMWHFIGHVQTNKIKYMAPFVHLVHGVDREKVLAELNKEAKKCNRIIDCLLQVHIAQEESKFGFDAAELKILFEKNLPETYPNLRVCGLMGMATFTDDEAQLRTEFRILKNLFDSFKFDGTFNVQPSTFNLLSMGMSGDYKIAIEEGSTMVRIGTAIFGARNNQ